LRRNVGLQLQARFFCAASATDSESGAAMAINMAAAITPVMMRLFILPPGVVRVKSRKMVSALLG
jgi:hypothetical protein